MGKCKLEINTVMFNYLNIIKEGYESGNFENLFEYLVDDCVYESQWVMTPLTGVEAIKEYLIAKGQTLKRTESFPKCDIIQLLGDHKTVRNAELIIKDNKTQGSFSMLYRSGELCLLINQFVNNEEKQTILRITLNDKYKICRIDLCMPELFKYTFFYEYISLEPSNEGIENEDALIRIAKHNFSELYLFFDVVGLCFYEYDDDLIEIDKWIEMLKCWKRFVEFSTFDEAFEDVLNLDYSDWSSVDKNLLRIVSMKGYDTWKNSREYNLVYELIEWTEKYKNSCDHISLIGF